MAVDPWSRPTMDDLRQVLESIGRENVDHNRVVERLELSVPAEIITSRGNTVAAMTREISRLGVGFLHKGSIQPAEVTVKMASDSRDYEYRVLIEWCQPCDKGMFISGGRFLNRTDENS